MILYDSYDRAVELGASIGRGGEATVYRLAGQSHRLAKIYEPAPRPNYARKLAWMVQHPPDNPTDHLQHASLAWPDGLLLDANRQFKGYCMPYIEKAASMLDVFNPRRRSEILPQFDRLYLHRVAFNLCAALSALHSSSYIAGDLNESNVLVTSNALVTLIDVDSFQVVEWSGGKSLVHPCPVGKLEYTPPELQGKRLDEVNRFPEHDAFGLGVLVFQILMEGSHPFRAQWIGAGDPPSLETRIARGDFPYTSKPGSLVMPPKNALALDTLHPALVELVRRCFVDGHRNPKLRPSAQNWCDAIHKAEEALVRCAKGHLYSGHLNECPTCARGEPARKPFIAPRTRTMQVPQTRPASPGQSSQPGAVFATAGRQRSGTPSYSSVARGQPGGATPAMNPAAVRSTTAPAQTHPAGFHPASITQRVNTGSQNARPAAWLRRGSAARPLLWTPGGLITTRRTAQGIGSWLWERAYRSLWVGGVNGILAGALPGLVVGGLALAGNPVPAGIELPWAQLIAGGGAFAGFARGWNPGQRVGRWVERRLGWKRVMEWFGLAAGGAVGLAVGILLVWAILPMLLFPFLGARLGREAGRKIWEMGQSWGWYKIWAGVTAFMMSALGWVIAGLAGASGLDALMPYFKLAMIYADVRPSLLILLSGAFAGAMGGLIAGTFTDLVAGLLGLTD